MLSAPCFHSIAMIALAALAFLLTTRLVPVTEGIKVYMYTNAGLGGSQIVINTPTYGVCYINERMSGISSFTMKGDEDGTTPYSMTIFKYDDCSGDGFTYDALLDQDQNFTVNVLEPGYDNNVSSMIFLSDYVARPGPTFNDHGVSGYMLKKLTWTSEMVYVAPEER